jgi:Flp pilus assembly protein CpaB
MTIAQAEPLALAKGMPDLSLQLRARLATPAASSNTANATNPIGADSSRKQEEVVNKSKENQVL